jgi:hypothetical protein
MYEYQRAQYGNVEYVERNDEDGNDGRNDRRSYGKLR